MRVIDLFCGMGGLSLGFKQSGFDVMGFDQDRHAIETYRANIGHAEAVDLSTATVDQHADCIVGGPPCRPWSPMNLQRRRGQHGDYDLVRSFDRVVMSVRPRFLVTGECSPPRNGHELRDAAFRS